MYSKEVIVRNKTGIHARPATMFVKMASRFRSDVSIEKDGKQANCKSLINILSMGITKDCKIKISADGFDEEKAVSELVKMVEAKFGEA